MKAWSPRSETKASCDPSGLHVSSDTSPRTKKSGADFPPASGMAKACPPLRNATRSPLGEIEGLSPSTSIRGAESAATFTAQISTFGWIGFNVGSGASPPSGGQLPS